MWKPLNKRFCPKIYLNVFVCLAAAIKNDNNNEIDETNSDDGDDHDVDDAGFDDADIDADADDDEAGNEDNNIDK